MAKFYIVKATHKSTFKVIYKFGITESRDVLSRFSHTFKEREMYKDFNFVVIFSEYFPNIGEAENIENKFKRIFPNIPDINEYFGKPKGYYNTNNLTGLTEMRVWDDKVFEGIRDALYEYKNKRKN